MGLFDKRESAIAKVKYLGVTRGKETKVMSTVNFAVYSFLIEYIDGHREIKEYSTDSKKEAAAMNEILQYIPM